MFNVPLPLSLPFQASSTRLRVGASSVDLSRTNVTLRCSFVAKRKIPTWIPDGLPLQYFSVYKQAAVIYEVCTKRTGIRTINDERGFPLRRKSPQMHGASYLVPSGRVGGGMTFASRQFRAECMDGIEFRRSPIADRSFRARLRRATRVRT